MILRHRTHLQRKSPKSCVEFRDVDLCAPARSNCIPNRGGLWCNERRESYAIRSTISSKLLRKIDKRIPLFRSSFVAASASSSLATISFHRSWKYTGSCQRLSKDANTMCCRIAWTDWTEGAKNSRARMKACVVSWCCEPHTS